MPEIQIEITNAVGLHARPAALFVQAASQFESEITVSLDDSEADAKSILDILLLGANKGSIITVKAEGSDAEEALEAFKELKANNFGEKE